MTTKSTKPKVRPIIGRVGGKVRMAPKIIQHLQRFEWSLYCEPFAGSAAVYFRMIQDGIDQQIRDRKHHPRFVLNDADSRIVNLFRVCRDHATELALAAYFTPYSREEHRLAQLPHEGLSEVEEALGYLTSNWQSLGKVDGNKWCAAKATLADTKDENGKHIGGGCIDARNAWNSLPSRILTAAPHLGESQHETDALVEAARRYLVDGWQGFAAKDGWGISRSNAKTQKGYEGRDLGNATRVADANVKFNTTPDRILTAVSALKSCYIENDDAVKVIERWSCPHAAIYADPPYVGKEKYYAHQWTAEDHVRLAEALNRVEAACVIVSYYDCPEIEELYPADRWERHYYSAVASSAGITRQSKTKTRPRRVEMILVRK